MTRADDKKLDNNRKFKEGKRKVDHVVGSFMENVFNATLLQRIRFCFIVIFKIRR